MLLGNGTLYACRLAAVVLLAKKTTPEIVGQFETGMAIAAPVVLFFALELRAVLVADPRERVPLEDYRKIRRTGLLIAAAVLGAILLWFARNESWPMLAILAGTIALRLSLQSAELDWGIYQRQDRLDRLGTSNALRGLGMLAPFGLILLIPSECRSVGSQEWSAAAAIALSLIFWAAVSFLYDRPFTRGVLSSATGGAGRNELRRIANEALPLTLVALLVSLCDSFPRLILRNQSDGLGQLGHFGAIAYLPMAAHFVILQVGLAASRKLALLFESDRTGFWRLVRRLTILAVALGLAVLLVVWMAGQTILRVAFHADYAEHHRPFVILAAAHCLLLLASVWGYVLTQMRQFMVQLRLQVVITAITAVSAMWFIPQEPVVGAAYSALTRGLVHATLYGVVIAYFGWSAKTPKSV